jgi:hypothetical protein
MKTHPEKVVRKASQTATLLVADLRQAHKIAVRENPLLELILLDLLTQAQEMERKLKGIDAALNPPVTE